MKESLNNKLKIIIIGNYPKDKQTSMMLFSSLLENGYKDAGHQAVTWHPRAIAAAFFQNTQSGIGKWVAYLDKWLFFPIEILLRRLFLSIDNEKIRFHIADHSNVIYLKYLPNHKTLVTCHDVLAIRGALGYKDAYCDASSFGVILQRWILKGLLNAKKLASVSQTTLTQLQELDTVKNTENKVRKVVLNAFNQHFEPMLKSDALNRIKEAGFEVNAPFVLHIGSSLPRKNRKLLVEMLYLVKDQWIGDIVFAGQDMDDELRELVKNKGLEHRVKVVVHPSFKVLNALYSACDAFIFPSFSEGFGWPIIEAQACGAPVITSDIQPMPEVSGGAALYGNPGIPSEFANAFRSLENEKLKSDLVQKGFVNCNRFKPQRMIEEYLSFHLENTNEKTT